MIKFIEEIDKLFEEIGLGSLPSENKTVLREHIHNELEMRFGEKLLAGMSDDLIDEFDNFVDQNVEGMQKWYENNFPDYKERDGYKKFVAENPEALEQTLIAEYGAMKWLEKNCPEHPTVVKETFEEIKDEIRQNKEELLGQFVSKHEEKKEDDPEEKKAMEQLKFADDFLEELGLSKMSEDETVNFLSGFCQKLMSRIGEKLTDGMSEEKVNELSFLMKGNTPEGMKWLEEFVPNYRESQEFKTLLKTTANEMGLKVKSLEKFFAHEDYIQQWISITRISNCINDIISETVAMYWLQKHRPDYAQIVMETRVELKEEVIRNRAHILDGGGVFPLSD